MIKLGRSINFMRESIYIDWIIKKLIFRLNVIKEDEFTAHNKDRNKTSQISFRAKRSQYVFMTVLA